MWGRYNLTRTDGISNTSQDPPEPANESVRRTVARNWSVLVLE